MPSLFLYEQAPPQPPAAKPLRIAETVPETNAATTPALAASPPMAPVTIPVAVAPAVAASMPHVPEAAVAGATQAAIRPAVTKDVAVAAGTCAPGVTPTTGVDAVIAVAVAPADAWFVSPHAPEAAVAGATQGVKRYPAITYAAEPWHRAVLASAVGCVELLSGGRHLHVHVRRMRECMHAADPRTHDWSTHQHFGGLRHLSQDHRDQFGRL